MTRACPVDLDEVVVFKHVLPPPSIVPPLEEVHTFQAVGFRVFLEHRGILVSRIGGYTRHGQGMALADAHKALATYGINQGPTPLTVWVARIEHSYDRKWLHRGPDPRYYEGGRYPKETDYYEEGYRNVKLVSATVIYCSAFTASEGDPLPRFEADFSILEY